MTTATKTLLDDTGEKIGCSQSVYDGRWGGSRCCHGATVIRNDKPYCTIHDPVRKAEKRAERDRVWKEKWDQEKAERATLKAELVQQIMECDDLRTASALFDEIRQVR